MNKFFESGALLGDDLTRYVFSAVPAAANPMLEAVADPKNDDKKNDCRCSNCGGAMTESCHQPGDAKIITAESAHKAILEAAATAAKRDQLDGVVEAVFAWADSDDTSFDALDGYVQALAGLDDDDPDAEPTDDEIGAYNDMWDAVANFLVAAGEDPSTVSAMVDDEDEDAAGAIASDVAGIDSSARDELSVAYQASADDSMLEAVKKVIRNGEVALIKRSPRRRRLSAAQKMALKKARMKAHSSSAKLARAKSMKLRRKTFGK